LYDFKKVAVCKITQLNRGKKTAEIDGIKKINEKQKVTLVNKLKITGKVKIIIRLMMLKSNWKFQFILISKMHDMVCKTLFVLIFELEFKVIFE